MSEKLSKYNWKFFFVEVGRPVNGNEKKITHSNHVYIGDGNMANMKQQVQDLIGWVVHENIDLIFTYGDLVSLHAIPYIPSNVRKIFHCGVPSNTALSHATSIVNRLSKIVVNSKEISDKLVRRFRVPEKIIRIIPSAVDVRPFDFTRKENNSNKMNMVRLLFFGRINRLHKGTDLLPAIVEKLAKVNINFTLDIIGKGCDEIELRKQIDKKKLSKYVLYHGEKPPEHIPSMLKKYDILIMPTRFEGCPHSLLEAMAAGVVPVVTLLKGCTDAIVDDHISGILCQMDNTSAFVSAIEFLYKNPTQLKNMSIAAHNKIVEKYSLNNVAALYYKLFSEVIAEPQYTLPALPISNFKPNPRLYRNWRSHIPLPVRKLYYSWRAKLL